MQKKPDPKNCPHRDLEFEIGGKVLSCRDCGQRYHAMLSRMGSLDGGEQPAYSYHNVWVLHRDRRTWAPTLAEPAEKT